MNKTLPKISIVTVCLNSEKTIERTILSVKDQKYANLEYIIIDGGSTDNTIPIVKKYVGSVVDYYISEKDNGISDAFNKGIQHAKGEIIGIINSDDGYLKNALNIIASEYDRNVDIYRGNIVFWNTDTGEHIQEKPTIPMPYCALKMNVCHQSMFVRKEAYEIYGIFNTNYKYSMDYDLILRFEKKGAITKYIDKDLAYFTMKGITFSKYSREMENEIKSIIKNNGGSEFDFIRFKIIKRIKNLMKTIIGIDNVLKIKNHRFN